MSAPLIEFQPRQPGDKRPWVYNCGLVPPDWAHYEQGWRCNCRRFKNQAQAERWVASRATSPDEEGE